MLIGTAGHIDHGKTTLVGALTGRNTDRLPEEQARGISIELGYAYVPLAEQAGPDEVLGFVDVPGHERFVHTMLAGATGIDFALLVVAADDGVMPQTREHADILLQLGVPQGAVALTKVDLADAARRAAVVAQVGALFRGTPAAGWPVLPVSARSGEGVDALRAQLADIARRTRARRAAGRFRMAVDRVFTLQGVGTIVTGTVHAGTVHVGDAVAVRPGGRSARVRSIHAQDRPAAAGRAGQRCALNLAGLERQDVPRGSWVQDAQLACDTDRIDAVLRLGPAARALADRATVHLHHGSEDVLARVSPLAGGARIEPGAEVLVALSPARPLAVCRGDRFIVRDASASQTLGGGRVLDPLPPRRGRRTPARLQVLEAVAAIDTAGADARPAAGAGERPVAAEPTEAVLAATGAGPHDPARAAPPATDPAQAAPPAAAAVAALGAWLALEPVAVERLAAAWNLLPAEADALLAAAGARVAAGTAFAPAAWAAAGERVLAAVAATHEREPEMPGIEQQRLRRAAAPALAAEAFVALADELIAAGRLLRRGAFLAHPEHRAELARDERIRWERIAPLLLAQPYDPPRVRDLAKQLGNPPLTEAEVRALLRRVARVGEVTLVAHDHFFMTTAVAKMADLVGELTADGGPARAAAFRDRIGTGRKVAIQILEFFDRVGYTRRVRDDHLLRRDNPWRASPDPAAPAPSIGTRAA